MRRNTFFVIYLGLLAALSGWLMSHMSWIGRVGINFFHKEYQFLKTWYKGAALIFAVLLLFLLIQGLINRKCARQTSRIVHIIAITAALAGLWATYTDFRTDFTHGILKERFHLGAYLFWIGWISISLFLLTSRDKADLSEVQVKGTQ